MTTLLDAPCSTRDCVPEGPDLVQISAFRRSSSHEPFSTGLGKSHDSTFDDDDDSGQVTQFSPSPFKTPTKESSSPGSSELPSMPSEKSSSRGFSGECSSSGCPISEVTDTERSTSDCSLSPNTQRTDVNGGIVSPALLRLEDTVDSVLEKLENGSHCEPGFPTVRAQPTTPGLTNAHHLHPHSIPTSSRPNAPQCPLSPRQSPVAFTSPIWYSSSTEESSFCNLNGYDKYDAYADVSRLHTQQYSPNASFRAYETSSVAALTYGPPRSVHYLNPPFSYANDVLRASEKYRHSTPRYSASRYHPPGVHHSHRNFGMPNYGTYRFTHPSDHYYATSPYPANRIRSYHSPTDESRGYYSESATMYHIKPQPNYGGSYSDSTVFDTHIHCDTRDTSINVPLRYPHTPSDSCSPNTTFTSVSQAHHPRKYACGVSNSVPDRAERGLPYQVIPVEQRTFASPTLATTNIANSAPEIDRQSFSRNGWHPGTQLPIDTDRKSTNELSKIQEGQKRRFSCSISVRGTKRRRVVASKSNISSVSSTLTENLVRSLLLHSASQYLHDPVIHLPVTLCSPTPTPISTRSVLRFPSFPKARVSDYDIEYDQSINRKYSQFPMFLRSPKVTCSDDISLCHKLSQSVSERAQFGKLMNDNFLLKAVRRASQHNVQCSHQLVPSPHLPSVESNDLLDCLSSTDRPFRDSPSPLFRLQHVCTPSRSPRLASVGHQFDNTSEYSELLVSPGKFDAASYISCSHCLMQIVAPEHAIRWRLPEGENRVFCSSMCSLAYQDDSIAERRFTSIPPVPGTCLTTVASLLSDKDSTIPVLLRRVVSTKWMRGCGRKSLYEKVNRRRQENQLSHIRELLGIRRTSWRWFGSRWRNYRSPMLTRKRFQLGGTREKHRDASNIILSTSSPSDFPSTLSKVLHRDSRVCLLCHQTGDAAEEVAGRLLNYDFDVWLHLNCILWCYDTYETVSGSLVHVARSLKKAEKTICAHCGLSGAGLPCFHPDCPSVYHVPCAHKIGCSFYSDRGMFCPQHDSAETSYLRLTSLAVGRRVFIARDEDAQVGDIILKVNQLLDATSMKHEDSARLRVGGLVLHNVGQLLPEQLSSGLYHNTNFIYPVGYSSTRIYWSYRHFGRRCRYHCRIEDCHVDDVIKSESNRTSALGARFVIEVDEQGEPADRFEDATCDGVWQQVLTQINRTRQTLKANSLRIFQNHLSGEALYGLTEPHIIRAIESLPGVDRLSNYAFKFGRLQLIQEMPLAINPTGCARSEPKLRTHVRRRQVSEVHAAQHASLTRKPERFHGLCTPLRSSPGSPVYSSTNSSMIQSKSQQYRRLGAEWKMNVILARSRIQGLGLFAARDINKHTFIIEYLGELIRNEVGNRRERLYESQNRGVYMFRVDDDNIVDATMCGGLARYINHSCDPNCTAEVLTCENGSHIVIIAKRNIEKGEELTYDYKFDIEEDRWDRIPCLCGSTNCRQWMN